MAWQSRGGRLAGLCCSLKCVGGMAPAVRGQGPGLIHPHNPLLLAAASTLFNPSSPWSPLLSHLYFVLLDLGTVPLPHQHPQLLTSLPLFLSNYLAGFSFILISWAVWGRGAVIKLCQTGISTNYWIMILQNYFIYYIWGTKIIATILVVLFWHRVSRCSSPGWPGSLHAD